MAVRDGRACAACDEEADASDRRDGVLLVAVLSERVERKTANPKKNKDLSERRNQFDGPDYRTVASSRR